MNDFGFVGPFAEELAAHITLKRAVGYRYRTDEGKLRSFDSFTAEHYPNTTNLTREIVLAWCAKTAWETDANRSARASVLRQLQFICIRSEKKHLFFRKAFILPVSNTPRTSTQTMNCTVFLSRPIIVMQ